MDRSDGLLVGQVASLAGVTVKAVRHYEKLGLIEPCHRATNGYKHYDAESVVRVACVAALGRAGVPLSHVNEILDRAPSALGSIEVVAEVLRSERDRIDDQLRTLTSLGAAIASGEGPLEELGRSVVEEVAADLGEVSHQVPDDAWRIERRVAGLLASFGAGEDLPEAVRDYVRTHAVEVAAAVNADGELARLRLVSSDDPLVLEVANKIRNARSTVAELVALLPRPDQDAHAAIRSVIRPRLTAAQLAALRAAADLD
jgi:DNA-binding transcriptional MerR regulator